MLCSLYQTGMGNPRTVVPSDSLIHLILAYFLKNCIISSFISLDRDKGRHTTHCVYFSTVACFNEKPHIRIHERTVHPDLSSIWENELRVVTELFHHRKDVIPSPTVQSRGVIPQFINDFVHFKSCQDGLKKN